MSANPNRVSLGRAAAFRSWAMTDDRSARTKPGRDAAMTWLENQVDPDGRLDPAERRQRARYLQRARMTELSVKAAQARRAKAAAKGKAK